MAKDKPKKVPPKPAPKDKNAGKIVWVACRAKQGCDGQQAVMVFNKKTGGGGAAVRYRCKTCGGAFHINT